MYVYALEKVANKDVTCNTPFSMFLQHCASRICVICVMFLFINDNYQLGAERSKEMRREGEREAEKLSPNKRVRLEVFVFASFLFAFCFHLLFGIFIILYMCCVTRQISF